MVQNVQMEINLNVDHSPEPDTIEDILSEDNSDEEMSKKLLHQAITSNDGISQSKREDLYCTISWRFGP